MPVLNNYTMKAFRVNVAKFFAIICCVSIGIIIVSGAPKKHKASDGREYLIETEYQVTKSIELHNSKNLYSQFVTTSSTIGSRH